MDCRLWIEALGALADAGAWLCTLVSIAIALGARGR